MKTSTHLPGVANIAPDPSGLKLGSDAALNLVIDAWQTSYGLTAGQALVLRDEARGVDRRETARKLGIKPASVKKQGHYLVEKTGDRSVKDAALRLMRDVVELMHESSPLGERRR